MGALFTGLPFACMPVAGNLNEAGIPSRTLIAGSIPLTPAPGVVGGSGASASPQFAIGGGWATQITVVNDSASPITGRFDVFDGSGRPMAVRLNGFLQSTFMYSIPAGGKTVFAPRDRNGQTPPFTDVAPELAR